MEFLKIGKINLIKSKPLKYMKTDSGFQKGLLFSADELSSALLKSYNTQNQNIYNLYVDFIKKIRSGNNIFFCGNGGSFADAQHIVGELVVRFKIDRKPFSSTCLGSNSTILSAISNDFSYDYIFSRELEANYKENDMLICLSTSGKSKNIINVIKKSNELNIKSWLITGEKNPDVNYDASENIFIKSKNTPIIQEVTINLLHYICGKVEEDVIKK